MTMDVIQPEQNRNNRLALIIVSSGSWISKKSDVPEDNNQRASQRVQPYAAKWLHDVRRQEHGSSPRYVVTEMIPDMNRSVRFIRSVAKQYDIDPDHIRDYRLLVRRPSFADGGDDGR